MMIKLKDLFHIQYGNQADLNKLKKTAPENGIRFICRSSENLGLRCYVEFDKNLRLFKRGNITVALGGSLLSAFVQSKDFYTAQNIKVLTPREEMSEVEKYFYCYAIGLNRFRYTCHGREANKTMDDLFVPSIKEIPSWVYNSSKLSEPSKDSFHKKKVDLKDRNWEWFVSGDIFRVKGTKATPLAKLEKYGKGVYPYITTQAVNNGVAGLYDFKTEQRKVITVDSATVGYCSYQNKDFSASDHVELLQLENINEFTAMFLVTILNNEQYRYSYGRKRSQARLKREKIKLPITKEGKPDWHFMEYYIKSLPYSSNLREYREKQTQYAKP